MGHLKKFILRGPSYQSRACMFRSVTSFTVTSFGLLYVCYGRTRSLDHRLPVQAYCLLALLERFEGQQVISVSCALEHTTKAPFFVVENYEGKRKAHVRPPTE